MTVPMTNYPDGLYIKQSEFRHVSPFSTSSRFSMEILCIHLTVSLGDTPTLKLGQTRQHSDKRRCYVSAWALAVRWEDGFLLPPPTPYPDFHQHQRSGLTFTGCHCDPSICRGSLGIGSLNVYHNPKRQGQLYFYK